MIITIDGPVASGKSTIALILAQQLGYYYLYSGLLYRAVAYAALSEYGTVDNATETHIDALLARLVYEYDHQHGQKIFFDGKDVTLQLHTPVIDDASSRISVLPYVRKQITRWQRELTHNKHSVIDGRDAGSVVFAQADIKFFLDTTLTIRAERWLHKQLQQDHIFTIDQAIEHIQHRDTRDKTRLIDPLVVPQHAHIMHNEGTIQETVDQMLSIVKRFADY